MRGDWFLVPEDVRERLLRRARKQQGIDRPDPKIDDRPGFDLHMEGEIAEWVFAALYDLDLHAIYDFGNDGHVDFRVNEKSVQVKASRYSRASLVCHDRSKIVADVLVLFEVDVPGWRARPFGAMTSAEFLERARPWEPGRRGTEIAVPATALYSLDAVLPHASRASIDGRIKPMHIAPVPDPEGYGPEDFPGDEYAPDEAFDNPHHGHGDETIEGAELAEQAQVELDEGRSAAELLADPVPEQIVPQEAAPASGVHPLPEPVKEPAPSFAAGALAITILRWPVKEIQKHDKRNVYIRTEKPTVERQVEFVGIYGAHAIVRWPLVGEYRFSTESGVCVEKGMRDWVLAKEDLLKIKRIRRDGSAALTFTKMMPRLGEPPTDP